MALEESVALVIGADDAVGAAIARGLLARKVAKLYVMSADPGGQPWLPGAVEIVGTLTRRGDAQQLARQLTDVTLLICCTVATGPSSAGPAASVPLPSVPAFEADFALPLMEAFASVLAAQGGGTVVNVVSMPCADHPLWVDHPPDGLEATADGRRADSLRARLAAQGTQLLTWQAQLGLGSREQQLMDHGALARHLAAKVLARLDADAQPTAPPTPTAHWRNRIERRN